MPRITPHLHVAWLHALITFLEFLIIYIPVKFAAAATKGTNGLSDAIVHVL
jgi:hypothetical protein